MVKVYALDVSDFPDPRENEAIMKGIYSARKVKTLRYLKAEDRKLSMGAGILIRDILPEYGDSQDDLSTSKIGKLRGTNIQFNISHSYPYVILAVSSLDVGCDIEKVKIAPIDVAIRCFSKKELDYFSQCAEGEERNLCFYQLWTMKESYVKMTGEGMRLPFNEFSVDLNEGHLRVVRNHHMEPCFIENYMFCGYPIAVCARETEFVPDVIPYIV
jgi:4'-phosphopantetheinyl transferase